jgi:multiple RNA-binding domain-containing protein 1
VYQPPSKAKTWANDDVQADAGNTQTAEVVEQVEAPEGESDDEYQVIAKKPKTTQSAEVPPPSSHQASNGPDAPNDSQPEAETDEGLVEQNEQSTPAAGGAPVSDADWLRSRTNRVLDLVEDDEVPSKPPATTSSSLPVVDQADDAQEPEEMDVEQIDTAQPETTDVPSEEDKIRQTGRLYLRNLHYDVTSDDLREQFSKYGDLEEVSRGIFFFHSKFRYDEYPKIGTTDALHMRSTGRVF